MAIGSQFMTTEEFLAIPDDGIDRDLIRGEVREYGMTTRGTPHCRVSIKLSYLLYEWLRRTPRPRGGLYGGDIRVRIRRDPDTFVGIDLAYISPELEARTARNATLIDGIPELVVEIISPSDTAEGISEKIFEYQRAGVPLIWYVDPSVQTVTAYRLDGRHQMYNIHQDLTAEPELPGFRVRVAEIFED